MTRKIVISINNSQALSVKCTNLSGINCRIVVYNERISFLDIVTATAAASPGTGAGVASSAAMAVSSPNLFGNDHSFVTMEEEGENEGPKEKDGVHDCKCPRGFQHSAIFVDVGSP